MEELRELKTRLERQRPAHWEELPDLALYMDQVISYLSRQLIQFHQGEALTSAMVNNYIKDGLAPRAEGKRYGREHLGYLTAVCALKRVLSVRDIGILLAAGQATQRPPEELYGRFCSALDGALTEAAGSMTGEEGREELAALALELALRSYADQLACTRILEIIKEPTTEKGKPKKSRRGVPPQV